MKTIHDILSRTRYINYNKTQDSEFIKKKYSLMNTNNIEIIELYSNKVFSEFITYNNRYYIIWDNAYWELFFNYLIELSNPLNAGISVSRDINYFLALKFFDNIPLSSIHAYMYKKSSISCVPVFNAEYANECSEIYEIAKTYCFYHELGHAFKKISSCQYAKEHTNIKEKIIESINIIINNKIKLPDTLGNFEINEIDIKAIDDVFIDELTADVIAYQKTAEEFGYQKVADTFYILSKFQCGLIRSFTMHDLIYNLIQRYELNLQLEKVNISSINTNIFIRYKLMYLMILLGIYQITGDIKCAFNIIDSTYPSIVQESIDYLCSEEIICLNYARAKAIKVTDLVINKRNSNLGWSQIN